MIQAGGQSAADRTGLPKKWRPKFLGRVEILEKIREMSYLAKLPPSMAKAHNVVHVSRLKPHLLDELEANNEVIIDLMEMQSKWWKIRRPHRSQRNREYLVQHTGDTKEKALQMMMKDLQSAKDIVKKYEESIKGTVRRGRSPKQEASVTM